ncbi:hypothetical protein P7C70_g7511, partial [Phenoliferia sp. Uapishka_3]
LASPPTKPIRRTLPVWLAPLAPPLPPLTPAERLLIAPLPSSMLPSLDPPGSLSTDDFAEAILRACEHMGNVPTGDRSGEAGRLIEAEITASWLGADEELRLELETLYLDPSFAASHKYADAPLSVSHDPARDLAGDLLTGEGLPLQDDHTKRLSYAFAKSLSRATRLSYLTPVPTPGAAVPFEFSPAIKLKRQQLLYRSIIKSGVEAHAGCVLRYIGFCEAQRIPASRIFPAEPDIVLTFLSSMGGSLRTATIRAYANSIRFWHTIHGESLSIDDEHFRVLKQGLTQVQPSPKDPRPPVYTDDLFAVKDGLDRDVRDPGSTLDQGEADCIWAAATGAFYGMARSGDVTTKKQGLWEPESDLTVGDVKFYEPSAAAPAHVTLSLPFDKVKKRAGAVLYLVRQATLPRLDPVHAMAAHFETNRLVGEKAFAFSYRATRDSKTAKAGSLITLTSSHFTKTINKYLALAGKHRIWGHSFRIGGATMYLLAGKDIDYIRNIGRWSSNAFDRYWRDIKTIAANNLADAEYVTVAAGEAVSFAALLDDGTPHPTPVPAAKTPRAAAPKKTRAAKRKR